MKIVTRSVLSGLLPLASLVAYPNVAEAQWFQCPSSDYIIQTTANNTRARCFRPEERNRVTPDAGCPVGTFLDTDYSGNTDYCIPATGTVLGRPFRAACANGQEVERRSGRDRCYLTIPSDVKPINISAS